MFNSLSRWDWDPEEEEKDGGHLQQAFKLVQVEVHSARDKFRDNATTPINRR